MLATVTPVAAAMTNADRPLRPAQADARTDADLVQAVLSGDASAFEAIMRRHNRLMFRTARGIVRDDAEAQDVVQEAYLRALQYASGFRGGDARAWLLTIVRNTSYKWLRQTRAYEPVVPFDEEVHREGNGTSNPEQLLLRNDDGRLVEKALSELPVRFREILVLRELEGLSYKEIAGVMDVPMGTVMSTLSRARIRFREGAGRLLQRQHESDAVRAGQVPRLRYSAERASSHKA
jgi:RNA polymerase sigma-70 factor (ECF subfamily)